MNYFKFYQKHFNTLAFIVLFLSISVSAHGEYWKNCSYASPTEDRDLEFVIVLVELNKGDLPARNSGLPSEISQLNSIASTESSPRFSWYNPTIIKNFFFDDNDYFKSIAPEGWRIYGNIQRNIERESLGGLNVHTSLLLNTDSQGNIINEGWYTYSPVVEDTVVSCENGIVKTKQIAGGNPSLKKILDMVDEDYDLSDRKYDVDGDLQIDGIFFVTAGYAHMNARYETLSCNTPIGGYGEWYFNKYGFNLDFLQSLWGIGSHLGKEIDNVYVDGYISAPMSDSANEQGFGGSPLYHEMHYLYSWEAFNLPQLCGTNPFGHSDYQGYLPFYPNEAFKTVKIEEIKPLLTEGPETTHVKIHPFIIDSPEGWEIMRNEDWTMGVKVMVSENPEEYYLLNNINLHPEYGSFDFIDVPDELVGDNTIWLSDLHIGHFLDNPDGAVTKYFEPVISSGADLNFKNIDLISAGTTRFVKKSEIDDYNSGLIDAYFQDFSLITFPYDEQDIVNSSKLCLPCYYNSANNAYIPEGCNTLAETQGGTPTADGNPFTYNCGLVPISQSPRNSVGEEINGSQPNTRKFKLNGEGNGDASGILIENIVRNTDRTIDLDITIDPPPSAPKNPVYQTVNGDVILSWDVNPENDFYAYLLYFSLACLQKDPLSEVMDYSEILIGNNSNTYNITQSTNQFFSDIVNKQGCIYLSAVDKNPEIGVYHESKSTVIVYPPVKETAFELAPGWNYVGLSGGIPPIFNNELTSISKDIFMGHIANAEIRVPYGDVGFDISSGYSYWIFNESNDTLFFPHEYSINECEISGNCYIYYSGDSVESDKWYSVVNPYTSSYSGVNDRMGIITEGGEQIYSNDPEWSDFISHHFKDKIYRHDNLSKNYEKLNMPNITYEPWESYLVRNYLNSDKDQNVFAITMYKSPATAARIAARTNGTLQGSMFDIPRLEWGAEFILYDGNDVNFAEIGVGKDFNDAYDSNDVILTNLNRKPEIYFDHDSDPLWTGNGGKYSKDLRNSLTSNEAKIWNMNIKSFNNRNPYLYLKTTKKSDKYEVEITDLTSGEVYSLKSGVNEGYLLLGTTSERVIQIKVSNISIVPEVVEPPTETQPLATIKSTTEMGSNKIVKNSGEVFDIKLFIEAKGFTDTSFVVDYDDTVIAPCVRDAQYPNDASKCMVLAKGDIIPITPDSALSVWNSLVGNSVHFDLISFGEPLKGNIALGSVSFKVLSSAIGKMTEIHFVSDDNNLTVLGKIDGEITSDYDINASSVSFFESHYLDLVPPVVNITGGNEGGPVVVGGSGGTASIAYEFSDNFYDSFSVTMFVKSASGNTTSGTEQTLSNVASGPQTYSWTPLPTTVSGTYDIVIQVTDPRGNVTEEIIPVIVDRSAPVFSFTSPESGKDAGTLTPVISVKVDDGVSGAGVDTRICATGQTPGQSCGLLMKVDGQVVFAQWVAAGKRISWQAAFGPGANNHIIEVKAADKAGNVGTHNWEFNIDTKAPSKVVITGMDE